VTTVHTRGQMCVGGGGWVRGKVCVPWKAFGCGGRWFDFGRH
jgi:hypothetical protein